MLKSYVCFDLETTGLDPLYNEIIEIGALKVGMGRLPNVLWNSFIRRKRFPR